jgi:hypothetical protein
MNILIEKNNNKKRGFVKQNNKYNKTYGMSKDTNAGAVIIHKIEIVT